MIKILVLLQEFGKIKSCNNHIDHCKNKCCSFTDNYIVLYPGEYEEATGNKSRLIITDEDYFGGKKAICTGYCTEDDFKPLDCKSYPYFPTINKQGDIKLLKGTKCPLQDEELIEHKQRCIEVWQDIIQNNNIFNWLKMVKLIGYKPVD